MNEFKIGDEFTTSDELDALPRGAIVVDDYGLPAKKEGRQWRTLNGKHFDSWEIFTETKLTLIYLYDRKVSN